MSLGTFSETDHACWLALPQVDGATPEPAYTQPETATAAAADTAAQPILDAEGNAAEASDAMPAAGASSEAAPPCAEGGIDVAGAPLSAAGDAKMQALAAQQDALQPDALRAFQEQVALPTSMTWAAVNACLEAAARFWTAALRTHVLDLNEQILPLLDRTHPRSLGGWSREHSAMRLLGWRWQTTAVSHGPRLRRSAVQRRTLRSVLRRTTSR